MKYLNDKKLSTTTEDDMLNEFADDLQTLFRAWYEEIIDKIDSLPEDMPIDDIIHEVGKMI